MKAICMKISQSGKSMLVGVTKSKYSQGIDQMGYCANPDGLKVGDIVEDFTPTGLIRKQSIDANGEPILNEDGSPQMMVTKDGVLLSFWVF